MMTYGIKDLILLGRIAHCVDCAEACGVLCTPSRIATELKKPDLVHHWKFHTMIATAYESLDPVLYRGRIAELRLASVRLRKHPSEPGEK
jgi:hypothetical protein